MKPGEQKPHWAQPWAIHATCRGCMSDNVPMPSMVVISAPSLILPIFVRQERVTLPSTMTLQAPQWPSPQPILQPVSSRRSRRKVARVSFSSTRMLRLMPLIIRVFLIIMLFPP